MSKKFKFITSLIITFSVFVCLITGAPLLTHSTPGLPHIPVGTFITGLGIIALSYSIYLSFESLNSPATRLDKILNTLIRIAILYGLLWIPISYILAGNMSFTFTEKTTFQGGQVAMKIFWVNCILVVILPVIIGIVKAILNLRQRHKLKP